MAQVISRSSAAPQKQPRQACISLNLIHILSDPALRAIQSLMEVLVRPNWADGFLSVVAHTHIRNIFRNLQDVQFQSYPSHLGVCYTNLTSYEDIKGYRLSWKRCTWLLPPRVTLPDFVICATSHEYSSALGIWSSELRSLIWYSTTYSSKSLLYEWRAFRVAVSSIFTISDRCSYSPAALFLSS